MEQGAVEGLLVNADVGLWIIGLLEGGGHGGDQQGLGLRSRRKARA